MKIAHISDLHIGKYLKGYSLAEDQRYILKQIVEVMKEEAPDVLLIAGDIYDKSAPSGEAFSLFDEFLGDLDELPGSLPVLIIAGNHDSPERLDFASGFLERHHIYISTMPPQAPDEFLKKVVLEDGSGPVNFYLLPFTRPGDLRGRLLQEGEEIRTYQEAIQYLLDRETIDWTQRNVIVSHQFYQGSTSQTEVCDSELARLQVGGLEVIDSGILQQFDYVALGHIHGAQQVGKPWIRYSGTPLKYSVSECNQRKGITIVTLEEKGMQPAISQIPLRPLRDVRKVTGTLEEIIRMTVQEEGNLAEDYVSVALTDDAEIYRPKEQLEKYLHHLLELELDCMRMKLETEEAEDEKIRELVPQEAFAVFFEKMTGRPMHEEERAVFDRICLEAAKEVQE